MILQGIVLCAISNLKFSLADTLLKAENIKNEFKVDDLAFPYALKICNHLKSND